MPRPKQHPTPRHVRLPDADIETYLLGLLAQLHATQPEHPMFSAAIEPGVLAAPYQCSKRANGVCWRNIVKGLAGKIKAQNPGVRVGQLRCWMVNCGQYKAAYNPSQEQRAAGQLVSNGGNQRTLSNIFGVSKGGAQQRTGQQQVVQPPAKKQKTPAYAFCFLYYRFTAFLRDPSEANWAKLCRQEDPTRNPFSHLCGRGQSTGVGTPQGIRLCVNGIEHGSFSTRGANEGHKMCKWGDLAGCPGHPDGYCVFTHPDGYLKPCCMHEDHKPICTCPRRCFPHDG